MDQWAFIERAAAALGVTAEAFRKWRVRGVPRMYRLPLIDAATEEGFPLDRAALDAPPGPKRFLHPAEEQAA